MTVRLEHANITVSSPESTAAWMQDIFGWHIRWQGEAISGGYSLHVGEADSYLALYCPPAPLTEAPTSYAINGGLNHIAVVVDDLDAVETRVRAAGFTPGEHHDYEPGRRFYFRDRDNIEFEVVQYDA
ncbi:VOC family protein [Phaeobacter piscinae]|uniref:VOC family protein n=1 Tax=Phaeobacter piscinae TaxID=1580596 RepID=UPI000BBE406E|nr:VOC family protein [Phaeobacter piscinae]ATG38380.1 glyoxalase/bleomycin resistance protein domain-containing protein [Phaeobacter piscinae]